ncbi:MAG: anti-sigma factor family protein [Planctomycetota bacterium]
MDCKQAKILLAPHVLGDLDNEGRRCQKLQAHLLCCPDCAEMYDGFKETIGFVLDHKTEFAQAFEKVRAGEFDESEYAIELAKTIPAYER